MQFQCSPQVIFVEDNDLCWSDPTAFQILSNTLSVFALNTALRNNSFI